MSVPAAAGVTEDPDEDLDEDDDSAEADDDGRVYKNPRNHPSPDCPRDEEQATLLGKWELIFRVTFLNFDFCRSKVLEEMFVG